MPTIAAERAFRDATEAVADGRVVDFDGLERTYPELTGRLRHLRLLASISGLSGCAPLPGPQWPSMEGERWGPLEVREKVGEGTFGEVYRAHDPVLERDVALKLSRAGSEAYDAHLQEARRLARVRHPAVVVIHGIEAHDERVGLWMDFVRGESLEDRLEREGPLSADEVARIGVRLAGALGAVHDAGLVHGDVKAANVMIGPDAEAVLMDFGAGREGGGATSPVMGTPLAMAPEVLAGGAPTRSSDLYALGVLLHRLATGRYPLVATTPAELRDRIRTEGIAPVASLAPSLPESLATAIDRALDIDPAARPASAADLADALRTAPGETPPVPEGIPHNLRRPDTRFVGRTAELAGIREAVRHSRLVTLVGMGGAGKTRLAVEAAHRLAPSFPDGVHWTGLVAVDSPEGASAELCRVLDLAPGREEDRLARIASWLGERAVLLVLDNAEHLLAGVADLVRALLDADLAVRVLVTSRTRLDLDAEVVIPVAPFEPPTKDGRSGEDAIALFTDRAERAHASLVLGPSDRPHVAAICRQVDGIPLLLELAAARARTFPVAEIASRLARSFAVLRDSGGGQRPGHETADAVLGWSVDLLTDAERTLFARLAVFRGGWPIEAVGPVCGDPDPSGVAGEGDRGRADPATIGGEDPAELLATLVERSLVVFDGDRYGFLDVVREHAWMRLEETGTADEVRSRHLDWCLAYAGPEFPRTTGPEAPDAFARLDRERPNLEEALRVEAHAPADVGRLLQLFHDLSLWWFMRGPFEEIVRMVDTLLAIPEEPDSRLRGIANNIAACCLGELGDRRGALARFRWVRDHYERLGLTGHLAEPHANMGLMHQRLGENEEAIRLIERALELHRENGNRRGEMFTHLALGNQAQELGNLEAQRAHVLAALEIQKELGDPRVRALGTMDLAGVEATLGHFDRAVELSRESVEVRRRMGDPRMLAEGLTGHAHIALDAGLLDEASDCLRESFALLRTLDAPPNLRHAADVGGRCAWANRDAELAAFLLAYAVAFDADVQDPWRVEEEVLGLLSEAREELGAEAMAAIEARARELDPTRFLDEVLARW